MRARLADSEGFVEHDGVKIHFEVYGEGGPTILLLPTWTIIHKRFWKGQIPYLARHHRVIVYDGPGNGRSDRPLTPDPYGQEAQTAYALKVLEATGTDRAVLVALSMAASWALDLAANHADRVHGTVLIGPTVPLGDPAQERAEHTALEAPRRGSSRRACHCSEPIHPSTGRSTTANTGSRTTTTSSGSSWASASRSATPPSRSRMPSAGAGRRPGRCSRPRATRCGPTGTACWTGASGSRVRSC